MKLVLVVTLSVACDRNPCGALEGVRQQMLEDFQQDMDHSDWTKAQPADQKRKAAEATVTAILAKCVDDHWSQKAVECIVAEAKAERASTAPCTADDQKRVSDSFDKAQEAALAQFFGPQPPGPNPLEKLEQRRERYEAAKARKSRSPEPHAIIPAHYPGLAWFARQGDPLFDYAQRLAGRGHTCVDDVLSTVDGHYQTHNQGGLSLIAVTGTIDRADAEGCIQQVVAKAIPGAQIERDGAITRIHAGTGSLYLGWASDDTVYLNDDRAVVEEALAQKTTITANAPVMALMARADVTKRAWYVEASDLTSKLIGVPSTGVLFASDMLGTKHTGGPLPGMAFTIEFASAADALRAVIAIRARHTAFSPALQEQIGKLSPLVHDRDVEIDIAPFFEHLELFDEMNKLLSRLAAQK